MDCVWFFFLITLWSTRCLSWSMPQDLTACSILWVNYNVFLLLPSFKTNLIFCYFYFYLFFLQEKFWRPVGLQPDPLVCLATRPLKSLSVPPREMQSTLESSDQSSSTHQLPSVLLLGPGRDVKQRISNSSHFQHLAVTSAQVHKVGKGIGL